MAGEFITLLTRTLDQLHSPDVVKTHTQFTCIKNASGYTGLK